MLPTPRLHRFVLLGSWLAGLLLRLWRLDKESFWLDEAVAAYFTGFDLPTTTIIERETPPLFRLLAKLWVLGTGAHGDVALRVLPALIALASLPLFWVVARRLLPERPALLASVAFALNPSQLGLAQEFRTYSLLTVAVLLATLACLRWIQRPSLGRSTALTVALAMGFYTHYAFAFAALVLAGAGLLAVRRHTVRLWPWLAVCAGSVALYVPWIAFFVSSGGGQRIGASDRNMTLPWAQAASIPVHLVVGESGFVRTYPWSPRDAVLGQAWLLVPLGGVLFLCTLFALRERGARTALAASAFIVALAAALFPWVPFLSSRYLSFLVIPVLLVLSAGALAAPRFPGLLAGALLALELVGVGRYFLDPRYGREAWAQAARFVETAESHDDVVVFDQSYMRIPFERYYRGNTTRVGLPYDITAARQREAARAAVGSTPSDVFWVRSHTFTDVPSAEPLEELGYCLRHTEIYPWSYGIELSRFSRCQPESNGMRRP